MAKRKNRTWLVVALVVVIGALIAVAIYKAKQKPKGEIVSTEKVSKRTVKETVSASGRIFPETEVKISSDVSGEIVELLVEEGDSVYLGQILAKIDPEAYESSVERGAAGLNNAKAQLAMSKTQIQNSQAQKENILAQLANAEKIQERNETLMKDGVISQAEYDQSLSNLNALKANLRSAEASLQSARENAEGAAFSVKSSEASLKELRTSLNRTTIKSPTNGIISSLSVEAGERVVGTIQMTGTEMMRIANLSSMEVQVEVSENDILKVALRDEVEIDVDAYLDDKFKGVVTEIASSAANTSSAVGNNVSLNTDQVTNFIVKIRIDPTSYSNIVNTNNQYPFRPGMSASVDIFTEVYEDALSIPIQAVTVRDLNKDNKEKKEEDIKEVVFVLSADTVKMVQVITGIQDDEYITVTEGLGEDDVVVIGPYSTISRKLEQGDQIREEDKEKGDNEKKS